MVIFISQSELIFLNRITIKFYNVILNLILVCTVQITQTTFISHLL